MGNGAIMKENVSLCRKDYQSSIYILANKVRSLTIYLNDEFLLILPYRFALGQLYTKSLNEKSAICLKCKKTLVPTYLLLGGVRVSCQDGIT